MAWTHWFPFKSFRPHQEWALEACLQAFEKTDVVILQAPCGLGKSPLAITLAKYFKSAYITTVQKSLQDQYVDDFSKHLALLKGKSNYQCQYSFTDDKGRDVKYTCDKAPCGLNIPSKKHISEQCREADACPYLTAKRQALEEAEIALLNYSNLLHFSAQHIPRRKLVIYDEVHRLEGQLYSFAEIILSKRVFEPVLDALSSKEVKQLEKGFASVEDLASYLRCVSGKISKALKKAPSNDKEEHELEMVGKLYAKIVHFLQEDEKGTPFVLKKDGEATVLSPLYIQDVAPLAFKCAEKALLMSATIGDAATMAKNLGIKDFIFIDVPSSFPPENNTIISIPVGSLSYKNIDETFPKVIKYIKAILKHHPNEKGVIQTYNYAIADRLKSAFADNPRMLFHTRFSDKNELFEEHCNSPDATILVGPGFKEGIDLFEDRCRFQIILKLPCPDLKDPIISTRSKLEPIWYDMQVAIDLQQMLGRPIRSQTDKATQYILDGYFPFFYQKRAKLFPEELRKSISFA